MKKLNLDHIYKSVLSSIKDIKERNAAFNALSPKQKRQEIAFDSLTMLLKGIIIPSQGCYWSSSLTDKIEELEIERSPEQLQKTLINDKLIAVTGCKVCARGAIMMSTIRKGNTIAVDVAGFTSLSNLSMGGESKKFEYFSIDKMEEMENLYEAGYIRSWRESKGELLDLRKLYQTKYPYYKNDNSEAILGNILLNVIHNGNFKRTDMTDYVKKYKLKLSSLRNNGERDF